MSEVKIIELGMHPFADTFISSEQLSLSEPVYPLECFLNKDFGEIKLGIDTKADDRYNLYDYSYTSSNSNFSKSHWIDYAKTVSEKVNLQKDSRVVEIGSNDGFLAKEMKDLGFNVVGVDPSEYMADIADKRGIKTYVRLFNSEASKIIKDDFGSADLIIANNVFNHSNDPLDFINGISNLLVFGTFVYELPYWYHTIKDGKFDQIYHEHVTYFTAKYSYELLRKAGLEIVDIDIVDYHGGSLRVFARKVEGEVKLTEKVSEMILEETSFGLFNEDRYKTFMNTLHNQRNILLKQIYKIKSDGYSIIGVGAAAKANTFLNFYNLDNKTLDYITDSSEHKQGKYTPLTRIPIVGDEIFSEYEDVYALILSWNISDIIKENLKRINENIKFISLPGEIK
jgi:ubiquinone/menaquinone biosynthesis C-methylase UbiE